jgi:lipopolysaccharide export system permease protein
VRLLSRYVLGRLVAPFLFALAALTGFMLLSQVARRFEQLTGKGLEWQVIAEVFGLSLPFILALTIPMAVLVAVLFAFSQLAADNEVTAMRASGVSLAQLVGPVLVAALAMSACTFAFVDQVLPRSNARLRNLYFDIARKKPTFELHEQIINPIPGSSYYVRAAVIDQRRGIMRNVAIYDLEGQWSRRVIYADSGRMAVSAGGADLVLELQLGEVHEFPTSAPSDFRLIGFQSNRVVLHDVYDELQRNTGDAVRGDREMSSCEMLEVVRQAKQEAGQARVDRWALLERDLRYLAGIPAASPPPPAEEPRSGYCAWLDALGRLVLPRTAEAASSAQQPGWAQQLKLPRQRPPTQALTTWGEITSAASTGDFAARRAAQYEVEVHKKFVIAVACLPFALVAIVLALRFPRGGVGLVIGGAMAVFSVFWVGLTAGEALADKHYVSPWLAMWSPILILSTVGVVGLLLVSREMGSTRGGDFEELAQWARDKLRRRKRAA